MKIFWRKADHKKITPGRLNVCQELFYYLPMAELFCYDVDDSTGNIDFFYNVAGQLVTQSFFCHVTFSLVSSLETLMVTRILPLT